jgi:type VI secretion system secreted protein Hcp
MQTLKQRTYRLACTSLMVVALAALDTGTAHAYTECFLKIEGVDGDSVQRGHERAIDVTAYSWDEKNQAQPSSPGGGGGHVQMDYLHVSMHAGRAGPALMLLAANGGVSRQAVLECTGTNAHGGARGPEPIYRWALSDVTINSFQSDLVGGQSNSEPLDQVALGFGKISLEYAPAAIKVEWDNRRNTGGFVNGGAGGQQSTTHQAPPKPH